MKKYLTIRNELDNLIKNSCDGNQNILPTLALVQIPSQERFAGLGHFFFYPIQTDLKLRGQSGLAVTPTHGLSDRSNQLAPCDLVKLHEDDGDTQDGLLVCHEASSFDPLVSLKTNQRKRMNAKPAS